VKKGEKEKHKNAWMITVVKVRFAEENQKRRKIKRKPFTVSWGGGRKSTRAKRGNSTIELMHLVAGKGKTGRQFPGVLTSFKSAIESKNKKELENNKNRGKTSERGGN